MECPPQSAGLKKGDHSLRKLQRSLRRLPCPSRLPQVPQPHDTPQKINAPQPPSASGHSITGRPSPRFHRATRGPVPGGGAQTLRQAPNLLLFASRSVALRRSGSSHVAATMVTPSFSRLIAYHGSLETTLLQFCSKLVYVGVDFSIFE